MTQYVTPEEYDARLSRLSEYSPQHATWTCPARQSKARTVPKNNGGKPTEIRYMRTFALV